MLTRRRFLYTGAAAAAAFSAIATDGFVESGRPLVTRLQIPLARLPAAFDGFTIAQLSDFHYEDYFSAMTLRKAVQVVNDLHPDLVALTGDFVTVPLLDYHRTGARRAAKHVAPCAQILQELRAPTGKFAVLGNHDAGSDPARIVSTLKAHGIPVMLNHAFPIERGAARFWLAGIDDALDGHSDLGAAIAKIPSAEAVVLLAHEPDFADISAFRPIDLQLSGHSHGGQVWIPGIGAPWLPRLGRKYPRGLYRIGNLTLYTNIGIGTIHARIRLNCPPEITLITLRAGPPPKR